MPPISSPLGSHVIERSPSRGETQPIHILCSPRHSIRRDIGWERWDGCPPWHWREIRTVPELNRAMVFQPPFGLTGSLPYILDLYSVSKHFFLSFHSSIAASSKKKTLSTWQRSYQKGNWTFFFCRQIYPFWNVPRGWKIGENLNSSLLTNAKRFVFLNVGRFKVLPSVGIYLQPWWNDEREVRVRESRKWKIQRTEGEKREIGDRRRMEKTTEHSTPAPSTFRCDPSSFFDSAHGAMRDLFSNPFYNSNPIFCVPLAYIVALPM